MKFRIISILIKSTRLISYYFNFNWKYLHLLSYEYSVIKILKLYYKRLKIKKINLNLKFIVDEQEGQEIDVIKIKKNNEKIVESDQEFEENLNAIEQQAST